MSVTALSYKESDARVRNILQSWHRYDTKKLRHCHPMYNGRFEAELYDKPFNAFVQVLRATSFSFTAHSDNDKSAQHNFTFLVRKKLHAYTIRSKKNTMSYMNTCLLACSVAVMMSSRYVHSKKSIFVVNQI